MADLPQGYIDDVAIDGPIRLLRRVPEDLWRDGVIKSSSFDEREEGCGLSVTVWSSPNDLEDVLRGHAEFGVICVTAAAFRFECALIARVPLEGNPNHCEVFPRMGKKARRRLRDASIWVHYGEWVSAEHRGPTEPF